MKTADRPLLFSLVILVVGGALIFSSAVFGLLARGAENISSVVVNHMLLGIGLGLVALLTTLSIDYKRWRRLAPLIFVFSLMLTALVFIPQIGIEHGGGTRWLSIAGMSFQPSETLKLAAAVMAAAYFTATRARLQSLRFSLGGLAAILTVPAILLVLQPDIGTLGIIVAGVLAVYVAAGAPWRHIVVVLCAIPLAIGALAMTKPYVKERVETFFNPSQNQQAEGYQIKQSLIAIGSGGLTGRGFGQGVQKFTYLPEPMGDSVFAVAAEELGFVGSVGLIVLYLLFALRGFSVASRAPDPFGSLLAVGISAYLVSAAFINIGAMLGIAPLTGIPLPFVSQGGSAMLLSLASVGILLNISKHARAA